jgi:hypothetical protein
MRKGKRCLVSSLIVGLFTAVAVSCVHAAWTETVDVDVLSSRVIVFNLNGEVRFNGSFLVSGGGGKDINFYITDPAGSRIVDLGRVNQAAQFEFNTATAGAYILHFDNGFSWFTPKTIALTYDVEGETQPNPIKPKNVLIPIAVDIAIIASLTLIGIGFAFVLRYLGKKN